jgi:hypothetical protein
MMHEQIADSSAPTSRWQAPFFTLWTGQAFSLLGSRIVQFALVWWLTDLTGSATVLATATMVALVPEIVLSPIAGAYVDRWNRRVVMIIADGLIALASLMGLVYMTLQMGGRLSDSLDDLDDLDADRIARLIASSEANRQAAVMETAHHQRVEVCVRPHEPEA